VRPQQPSIRVTTYVIDHMLLRSSEDDAEASCRETCPISPADGLRQILGLCRSSPPARVRHVIPPLKALRELGSDAHVPSVAEYGLGAHAQQAALDLAAALSFCLHGTVTAPSGASPSSRYFQNATNSFRARPRFRPSSAAGCRGRTVARTTGSTHSLAGNGSNSTPVAPSSIAGDRSPPC